MNKDSIQMPSAETLIASQKQLSAAAPKGSDARLRKRPEDEVLVAQAAPAAAAEGAAASAGAGVPAAAAEGTASAGAAAAGGSASTGAGAPAVLAAAAGGGSGLGSGALAAGAAGAGGVGLAAAGGGGGGGAGGGDTAPAPAPTPAATTVVAPTPTQTVTPPPTVTPPVVTPPPPPPPAAPAQIHNFGEYFDAINAGGATAAANATIAAAPGPTSTVDISGGFSRGTLPQTLSDLRPSMVYNVAGASVATIGDGGVVVDMQGNPDAYVVAHSNAAAGSSNLMWMQHLGVTDAAGQGGNVLMVSSTASGAGSDAEIGLQHVSMALAGTGALNGRTDLAATATGGGSAHTFVGDITLSVDSSAIGTSVAPVMSQIHMGVGEGQIPGILASATDAGSRAGVVVDGNVSLAGHGDDIYVYNSGIFAEGTNGGIAAVGIGGNVSFTSEGREAHSYILVDASTDAAAGSGAAVLVAGDVDLHSTGSELALTRAAVHADGTGIVAIAGHLDLTSDGPIANSFMQITSEGAGQVGIDSIAMNVNGGGHGWMDLYADHSGGLGIGTLNLSATAGSDVTLNVQHANDALTGMVDNTFLAHADGTVGVSIDTANVGGAGDIHMFLNSQAFGTINEAASLARLDVHYQLADQDFAGVGDAPMTTINGYRGELIYNGVSADATNFTNAGSFNTLAAMNTGLDAALDGTHKYVFAVYNGTADINGNGLADDHGSGVLAWDDDGTGVTSVLMLPGIANLTPTDIA